MFKPLYLGTAAALIIGGLANASIIVNLAGTAPAGGGNTAFNYTADLTTDERLDPNATNGVTCPAPGNAKVQCNPTGTFFTIYDINGFQSASSSAANWSVSSQLLGRTPSTVSSSIDDPTVTNVTFSYTGPVVGPGPLTFTGFQIISSLSGVSRNGTFSAQSTNNVDGSNGNTDQNTGPVAVPALQIQSTPEPASMGLIGMGLAGLALLRRRAVK